MARCYGTCVSDDMLTVTARLLNDCAIYGLRKLIGYLTSSALLFSYGRETQRNPIYRSTILRRDYVSFKDFR
jgi:hypothetical protein